MASFFTPPSPTLMGTNVVRRGVYRLALLTLLPLGLLGSLACISAAPGIYPALPSFPPVDVSGKWLYGTFSLGSFWGTDGRYQGAGYEQSMALDFNNNGTYDMYVINVTTYYNCRTGSYTHFTGKATFSAADQSILLTPAQGTYRYEYGCAPSKNGKRAATRAELTKAQKTYYYAPETDDKGGKALRIFFNRQDKQGAQFKPGNW